MSGERKPTTEILTPLPVMAGEGPPSTPLLRTAKCMATFHRHVALISARTRISSQWRCLRIETEYGCEHGRGACRSGYRPRHCRPQRRFQHRGRGAHRVRGEARQRRFSIPFLGSQDVYLQSPPGLLCALRALRNLCVKPVPAGKHSRGECISGRDPRHSQPQPHSPRSNNSPTAQRRMTHRPPMSSKRTATL
jgi:hypothetical protein